LWKMACGLWKIKSADVFWMRDNRNFEIIADSHKPQAIGRYLALPRVAALTLAHGVGLSTASPHYATAQRDSFTLLLPYSPTR
jgi:hypothetical protein